MPSANQGLQITNIQDPFLATGTETEEAITILRLKKDFPHADQMLKFGIGKLSIDDLTNGNSWHRFPQYVDYMWSVPRPSLVCVPVLGDKYLMVLVK
jgi:hypothetical protein